MKADIILVIRNGSLRGPEVKYLRRQLKNLVVPDRRLVLHMTDVESVDSQGAGAILEFARKLKAHGGGLRLVGLQKKVWAFFRMLQLHRAVEMCMTQSGAFGVEAVA